MSITLVFLGADCPAPEFRLPLKGLPHQLRRIQ
nr:MAG TPA: Protein of unknown function (DUF1590) [Caudoviricetes sp.]